MMIEIHIVVRRKFQLYDPKKNRPVTEPDKWFAQQEKYGNKQPELVGKSDEKSSSIQKDVFEAIQGYDKANIFVIGSWQTGDFGPIYAAAFCHYSDEPTKPFGLVVLRSDGSQMQGLINDIKFAIARIAEKIGGTFILFTTDSMEKDTAISVMAGLMKSGRVCEPYEATFMAEKAVKSMSLGEPLCDVWSALMKKEDSSHYKFYADICRAFTEDYISKFGMSYGREQFICVWARTSGMPTPKRPLGGANPQYDSSPTGLEQLCDALYKKTKVKAIMLIDDGFNVATKAKPYVFDLGQFWRKASGVMGRFQENGFFYYMTMFYDCDIVHVGMKSGGMDSLGLWGQKVVFIDSMGALKIPEITKRVEAWNTQTLKPVRVGQLPTGLGQAIEEQRKEADGKKEKPFKTTFATENKVNEMIERANKFFDGFQPEDLDKICIEVTTMLSLESKVMGSLPSGYDSGKSEGK